MRHLLIVSALAFLFTASAFANGPMIISDGNAGETLLVFDTSGQLIIIDKFGPMIAPDGIGSPEDDPEQFGPMIPPDGIASLEEEPNQFGPMIAPDGIASPDREKE